MISKRCRLRTAENVKIIDSKGESLTIQRHERKETTIFWIVLGIVISGLIGYCMALCFLHEAS